MAVELDIAGNIKTIESIKCDLLSGVSELFSDMLAEEPHKAGEKAEKRLDDLSDIVIAAFRLADKLGASYKELDLRIVSILKLNALDDNGFDEAVSLLKHFDKS